MTHTEDMEEFRRDMLEANHSEAHNFAKYEDKELTYAEVQESQIKRNEELFKGNSLKSDLEADLLKIADANGKLSVHQAFGLFSKHLGSCGECKQLDEAGWCCLKDMPEEPNDFCSDFERKDKS